MSDHKRQHRELKRDLKREGNRKRRRYLKNPEAELSDFPFGKDRTDLMNERSDCRKRKERGT